jgi:adenylyltransferase/sulfurtransferase
LEIGKKYWGEDVYPLLSWFETRKVREARIMVVGVGALGNEALKNLALFGVGCLVIVDFDTIEYGNLTRSILFRPEDADKGYCKADVAAQRLKTINPAIQTFPVCANLLHTGLGLYRRVDAVIGCVDSLGARIALNRLCHRAGKTWIDGGIGELEGQVSVYQPGKNCYECTLTDDEKQDMNSRAPCAGIVTMNEQAGRTATTPVSASIIAAIQVQEAMKIIHPEAVADGRFTTLAGRLFAYEGQHPAADIYDFTAFDRDCLAHEYWNPVIEASELSADTTVAQALTLIEQATATEKPEINMRNDRFVDIIVSRTTNRRFCPMLPESKLGEYIRSNEELSLLQRTEGFYQNAIENIDASFPYPHCTLLQVGIPYFDILQVTTPKGVFYVELTNDKRRYEFAAAS